MARFIKSAFGALLAANVLMSVIAAIVYACGGAGLWFGVSPGLWPWVWTLITYMFTNTGILNLLFNCLWLWIFARMVEEVASDRQLLLSYFIGGLCGAAFFLLGAALGLCSGILFGSSAAILAIVSFAAVRVPYMRLNLMFFGPVKFMWIGIIAAIISLLPINGLGTCLAHLGGLCGGAIYALVLKHSRRRFTLIRRDEKKSLDELLDKVRRSGYASLNASERKQLLDYSKKL